MKAIKIMLRGQRISTMYLAKHDPAVGMTWLDEDGDISLCIDISRNPKRSPVYDALVEAVDKGEIDALKLIALSEHGDTFEKGGIPESMCPFYL